MTQWETVAILGTGMIGSSIGQALRSRGLAQRVIGISRTQQHLRQAIECGAIDRGTTDIAQGVTNAQLVVVCTPVHSIADLIGKVADACPPDCLVTDVGSTKATIVKTVQERQPAAGQTVLRFVGSHPLAGSEKSGPKSARADLLEGCTVVVTPTSHTADRDLVQTEQLWQSLGGHVVRLSPQAHDEAVAAISHLPHLVAAALAAATPDQYLRLASSGWKDTTRVASGDVGLWMQIFQQNRDGVLKSIDKFAKVLSQLRTALANQDDTQVEHLLTVGKEHRDTVAGRHLPR